MYEVFYNLTAEPFRLSPDHKFCYEHKGYAKARAYMAYAYRRAEGFVMITGRPGTGKTTLIGELVESLASDNVATANLVCTQLEADDLLKSVGYSFGIGSTGTDKAELLQRLTVLLNRWHREGRRALLIVDEAQDLSLSAMEELRLLTNIQVGGQPLLQIFLLGQPELRDLVMSAEMEQVHQRIVAASHLAGLEPEETEAYVVHRLHSVGWVGDPALDRAIFPLIHKFSEGVPRRINLICSRLFLLGSVEERHTIEVPDVRVVIGELQAENLAAGTSLAEQDFVTSGEPIWASVPGAVESEPEPEEVQLRAVNVQPLVANEGFAAQRAVDTAPEAKKKEPSSVTTLPQAPSLGVASNDFSNDFSNDAGEALSADYHTQEIEASVDPLPLETMDLADQAEPDVEIDPGPEVPIAFSEVDEDVELEPLYDAAPEPETFALTDEASEEPLVTASIERSVVSSAELSASRSSRPPVNPNQGLFWRRAFVLAVIVILMISAVLFFEIFMTRSDGSGYSVADFTDYASQSGTTALQPASTVSQDATTALETAPSTPRSQDQVVAAMEEEFPIVDDPLDFPSAAMKEDSVAEREFAIAADSPVIDDTESVSFGSIDVQGDELAANPMPADLTSAGAVDAAVADEVSAAQALLQDTALATPLSSEQVFRINFSFDSTELMADSLAVVGRVVDQMKGELNSVATITGFADSRGEEAYNLVLSRQRAEAVEDYLVAAGISQERLLVEGRGVPIEAAGIEDAAPKTAMEQLRVVQIKISRELSGQELN